MSGFMPQMTWTLLGGCVKEELDIASILYQTFTLDKIFPVARTELGQAALGRGTLKFVLGPKFVLVSI